MFHGLQAATTTILKFFGMTCYLRRATVGYEYKMIVHGHVHARKQSLGARPCFIAGFTLHREMWKTGKMAKKFLVRENTRTLEICSKCRECCQNTGNSAKIQGILCAKS